MGTWPEAAPSVTLTDPAPGELCSSLQCARAGVCAAVVATYGRMPFQRWSECSGQSYGLCGPCWDRSRAVVQDMIPGIPITGQYAGEMIP